MNDRRMAQSIGHDIHADSKIIKESRPASKGKCCACADESTSDAPARAPCGHHYCQDCLKQLFTLSLTDETQFPPQCCRQPIPAEEYHQLLPIQLLGDFYTRKVEMETVDRTYCHVPKCRKFIPPQKILHQVGRCGACDGQTCSVCKEASHVGDCPKDPAIKQLDKIAAQNGWKRCGGCHRIIEWASGCNHMSKLMPLPKLSMD